MSGSIYRPTIARVKTAALSHNIKVLRNLIGENNFFCCMVKANAYGHGVRVVASICQHEKVDALGVVSIEEAIELRTLGIVIPVLLFGSFTKEHLALLKQYEIYPVVNNWNQLEVLQNSDFRIHIEFNTGMNRLGFSTREAQKVASFVSSTALKLIGVCTHFLNGEDIASDQGFSSRQISLFSEVKKAFKNSNCIFHSYNSFAAISAASSGKKNAIDGARTGISLYGVGNPECSENPPLQPVLEIASKLVDVQCVKKNEVVSYGGTWQAKRDSLVGVVPIGYADGYHRLCSNKGYMLFRGKKVPQIGTICMDYTMVDLTEVIDTTEISAIINTEEIVILGQQGEEEISANMMASWCNTISYEVLTSIGERIPRRFI